MRLPRVAIARVLEAVVKWTAYVTAIVTAGGYLLSFLRWGQSGWSAPLFLQTRLSLFWSIAVTSTIVLLWIWAARLHSRFVKGFVDDFKGDPRQNWDFTGPWQITDGALMITGSDQGGLTKTGALWENYTVTFQARIVNRCLGVIVRAQDLDNYYMLQINKDRIRPHRRVAVPVVQPRRSAPSENAPGTAEQHEVQPITYTVGWQIFDAADLSNPLDDWFKVRVVVRGESLEMYINENLVWQHGSFLKISTGKIGFRNSGPEQALVRNIRVRLDQ